MENKEIVDLSVLEGVDGLPTSSLMTFNGKVATDVPTPEVLTFSQEMQNRFSSSPENYLSFESLHQSSAERLASQMFGNKLTEERGNINLGRDYVQLKSGKYIPKYEQFLAGVDNNERMAQLQNAGALEDGVWSRGWDRAWGTISTTFMGGLVGLPYGVASAINEGSWSAFYDNDLTSWLDDVAEKSKYNGNQIYYSQAEQDMSTFSSMGTSKFWADKVLGGASFTIGTMGSELIWSALTGGSSLAGRVGQKALMAGLKVADKTQDVAKAGSTISKVVNKFNKAMRKSVTDAEAIARTTQRATTTAKWQANGAELINTGRFMLTSSAYEAGFEARHMKNESEKAFIAHYQEKLGRMPDQEEWEKFQKDLDDSSKNVAIMNMALLSVSNLAMFGKMFNVKVPLASGRAVSEGNALTRRLFGYGVKSTEDGAKEVVKSNFLQKGLRTAWGLGKSGATEGIWEEGGQGIASTWMKKYMESTYDPEAVATTLNEASSFISPYLKEAVSEQFGTKEGREEMLIGSIIGSIFGGFGTIQEQRQDRKNLDASVAFDNSSKGLREEFINKMYAQESILAKVGGASRSLVAQAEHEEAVALGEPVRAQLKAQESLISMLDSAYSVGKDGGFVDALIADMQSMDANKIKDQYGFETKEQAEEFIKNNIVEVERLAKRYAKSRELAETIASQASNELDRDKIVRGLSLALTTRGSVAEIVKDASVKLKSLLEQNGNTKRGLIAQLGTLQSLISNDANKEFEALTEERLKLEEEHKKLTKELKEAQENEDIDSRKNRVDVINQRLAEVDEALSNNNKKGEEMIKSLSTPIFGDTQVDFTYNSLIELFKEEAGNLEETIEKEKVNNPLLYLEMKDAFDVVNEGSTIFRSFDEVLVDFSSKDFKLKPSSPLAKLFKKGDVSVSENTRKVIEDLGNLSLSISDAPLIESENEVSDRENELKDELSRREALETEAETNSLNDDVLSEIESENISAPIEEENELSKEVEENREKEVEKNKEEKETTTTSTTGLKPVSSMTIAEIKQELEEIKKEKVENAPQQNPVQDRQKYYENFVNRLGERFNVNVKWEDGGHPSQPNAKGWYDSSTNTAHINNINFDGTTAVHEIFGHPFLNKIKTEKPELYNKLLKEALANSEAVKYVDEYYEKYPEAKNDEAILYVLDLAVRGELSKINPNKNLLQSINQLIKELKDFVKDLLGIESIEELPNDMNIADLAQMAFYGKNKLDLAPPTFEGKQVSLFQLSEEYTLKENKKPLNDWFQETVLITKDMGTGDYYENPRIEVGLHNDVWSVLEFVVPENMRGESEGTKILNEVLRYLNSRGVSELYGQSSNPLSAEMAFRRGGYSPNYNTIEEVIEAIKRDSSSLVIMPTNNSGEFNVEDNNIYFQLSPEQREARIKELQDELARRKAKIEQVHEKYDNMYLKFVEEGKLTREQAIREMEKYNRTDSNAYRALIQGIEDVILEEQKVDELLMVENLIQKDAEYLKEYYNIDVNNIEKPTKEEFSRMAELSAKSSLTKAEKEEYERIGAKTFPYNVARGTMVKDGISLMDLITLKAQLAKAKNMALNESRSLPVKDVVENDLESLQEQEERLKGQDGVGRQNNLTQVTEDVYIQYNQKNNHNQRTKNVGISHMSLSDIMEKVVSNNPDAIITTPSGEEIYSDFEKYNGLANVSLFVSIDGKLTEFHVPRNTSHDKDGATSGRPVTMIFNEQFGTPEAQLKQLTGIDTYADSTTKSSYVLGIENDAPIKSSKSFEPKGGGIVFDPEACAKLEEGDEVEILVTLEDDFNRELHNITAKEEMVNAREKQKATVTNLKAQLENEKKYIKDEFIAEDVENKLKGAKKTKENLELALRIFGIPSDIQKEYNKAKESLNKFKAKGKNTEGRKNMRAEINGGALNVKRFTLITETGKRGRISDGEAKKGMFYDKVDKVYLTTAQADKVMFELEVAKREKALKEPNYGEIVFERIQKGDLNVKEAILKKGNARNYITLSSQGKIITKIEEKINKATTELNRLTDLINDTAIIANDSIEFQRNANFWVVLPGTKIAVGRLKASYEKVDASEKSRGLIGVRSLLSSQLSADNIEARVKTKVDFAFIGTPIHNYENGVPTPQNVTENDIVGHGYIENGTMFAKGMMDFESVFIRNISKKNVDVKVPFAVFKDKVSGKHIAYPVTIGNKTGAEAHDKILEILDENLPKGKKLNAINEVLINSQIPPIGNINVLDNRAEIQAMLDQVLEQRIPMSVEEYFDKFPIDEGVVQTTLNFKGRAFATPKHVLDLNNIPEAKAHLESLKLQGINYFKEETTKKAKQEATKDC